MPMSINAKNGFLILACWLPGSYPEPEVLDTNLDSPHV